jgi:hypothetical protein
MSQKEKDILRNFSDEQSELILSMYEREEASSILLCAQLVRSLHKCFTPEQVSFIISLREKEGDDLFWCIEAAKMLEEFSYEQKELYYSLLEYGEGVHDTGLAIKSIEDYSTEKGEILTLLKEECDMRLQDSAIKINKGLNTIESAKDFLKNMEES